jgi:hypothetical protein
LFPPSPHQNPFVPVAMEDRQVLQGQHEGET